MPYSARDHPRRGRRSDASISRGPHPTHGPGRHGSTRPLDIWRALGRPLRNLAQSLRRRHTSQLLLRKHAIPPQPQPRCRTRSHRGRPPDDAAKYPTTPPGTIPRQWYRDRMAGTKSAAASPPSDAVEPPASLTASADDSLTDALNMQPPVSAWLAYPPGRLLANDVPRIYLRGSMLVKAPAGSSVTAALRLPDNSMTLQGVTNASGNSVLDVDLRPYVGIRASGRLPHGMLGRCRRSTPRTVWTHCLRDGLSTHGLAMSRSAGERHCRMNSAMLCSEVFRSRFSTQEVSIGLIGGDSRPMSPVPVREERTVAASTGQHVLYGARRLDPLSLCVARPLVWPGTQKRGDAPGDVRGSAAAW